METFLKRKRDEAGLVNLKKEKCPHGERCFRRNPHHFKEYAHLHLEEFLSKGEVSTPDNWPQPKNVYEEQLVILKSLNISSSKVDVKAGSSSSCSKDITNTRTNLISKHNSPSIKRTKTTIFKPNLVETSTTNRNTMLAKLHEAYPYNILFTTVPKSPNTLKEPNSVTFTDLLCPSLGNLKCSLQLNFMIDIMWLMEQYKAKGLSSKPITILYGYEFPDMEKYIQLFLPNVSYHNVKMKDPFGTHHSKVGIYIYEDNSLRIVVSTANLYYEDWNHYNQGLWMSPSCPKMNESTPNKGESPTGFKADLLHYLKSYNVQCLKEWIGYVEQADFSDVRVFLVTSTPGKQYPKRNGSHVHRVAELLKTHCILPAKTTPDSEGPLAWGVLAQASSIGSLGKTAADWLRGTVLRSLACHQQGALTSNPNASLSFVYPSVDNVMNGYFGPESGGCLPYDKKVNEKQRWFQEYLYQWKADGLNRTRAMPHIKTYCRVSPCLRKLAYFLLTSANLSKSAWGSNIQKDSAVYVRSYEVGVMFLPKFFDEEYFEISRTLNSKNEKLFPFMYDLPLTSYKSDDYPWCN